MPQGSEVLDRPTTGKVWHGQIDMSALEDADLEIRVDFDEERSDRISFTGYVSGEEAFTFYLKAEPSAALIAQTGAQLALMFRRT